MYFKHVAFVALLANLGVEAGAVPSFSTSATAALSTPPPPSATTAELPPTGANDFPAKGEIDLEHIKTEVTNGRRADHGNKKCSFLVNVFGCSDQVDIGDYVNGVCEPNWKKDLPFPACGDTEAKIYMENYGTGTGKVTFTNKQNQKVEWEIEVNSPLMDGGVTSVSQATLPKFLASSS